MARRKATDAPVVEDQAPDEDIEQEQPPAEPEPAPDLAAEQVPARPRGYGTDRRQRYREA